MSPPSSTTLRGYAIALGAWSIAFALTIALAPYLVSVVFMMFWPVVFVSAWYGGRGASLLAIALSVLAVDYLMVQRRGPVEPRGVNDVISLVFFVVLAGGVAQLASRFRRSQQRALLAEAEAAARASELQEQAIELEAQAETLEQTSAAIQESESRFRSLFMNNPLPMWIFDLETLGFLDVNEAAMRQYGYSREEFLRMSIRDIRPEEDVDRLEKAVREPDDGRAALRGTFKHRRRDGSLFDAEVTVQAANHAGRAARLVLATDVTEREQLLRREREARSIAEEANRAKTSFLATMSHELRTPLNAIGGYTELLELGIHGPVTSEQQDALARIQRSQRHLLGLINDLLNFAKLAAGRVEYDIEELAVRPVIDEIEPLVALQIATRSLRFSRSECSDGLRVLADRDKVRQILINLLSNAIKFTGQGGSVELVCRPAGRTVRIMVRDTGIGIPPDRLGQIFEPFVQVDRRLNSSHEGTGLGLAISRDLARAMGGDITVESDLGQGSVFTLELPRAPAD